MRPRRQPKQPKQKRAMVPRQSDDLVGNGASLADAGPPGGSRGLAPERPRGARRPQAAEHPTPTRPLRTANAVCKGISCTTAFLPCRTGGAPVIRLQLESGSGTSSKTVVRGGYSPSRSTTAPRVSAPSPGRRIGLGHGSGHRARPRYARWVALHHGLTAHAVRHAPRVFGLHRSCDRRRRRRFVPRLSAGLSALLESYLRLSEAEIGMRLSLTRRGRLPPSPQGACRSQLRREPRPTRQPRLLVPRRRPCQRRARGTFRQRPR